MYDLFAYFIWCGIGSIKQNKANINKGKKQMCTFISSFPKHSKTMGAPKKNTNLEMFLQPCKDDRTYYRVRLLGIGSKVGRDDPHIRRAIHKAWVTDPKTGKKHLEKVVCTKSTPWIETEGPKASSCKICNFVGQQWSIYRESGKTDIAARQKAGSCGTSYEAIVPVYVRNDPNYEKNNGKFKVIIFNDKDLYEKFRSIADAKCREVPIFNGGKAVDCLLHVSQTVEEGKNGKQYKKTVIDKIKFSTEPYEIPAINSQSVDGFPFDETYFSTPDEDEVDEFYNKFCAISNNDIPEDDDIPVYKTDSEEKAVKPTSIPTNDVPDSSSDISDDDIDSLIDDKPTKTPVAGNALAEDPDNEGLDVPATDKSDDVDSEDILKELGI